MQELLAGAAIGSIITLLIMVVWHRASVDNLREASRTAIAELQELLEDEHGDRNYWQTMHDAANDRLQRIKNQFKDGKSGTAKLAVKIARGEVA